nr:flavoprotein [Acinetobacter sp. Marseille-Q1620]
MPQRKRNNPDDGFFQNNAIFFQAFQGKITPSSRIKQTNFSHNKVAIIGTDQFTVTHLEQICLQAKSVRVFQIVPNFILPKTQKGIQRVVAHPLIIKNRKLFNNRIKTVLALRYLDSQIKDPWLKRQLTPNAAVSEKVFFKSDTYLTALQRDNCKLVTWPIIKITTNGIYSMDGENYFADVIITTFK